MSCSFSAVFFTDIIALFCSEIPASGELCFQGNPVYRNSGLDSIRTVTCVRCLGLEIGLFFWGTSCLLPFWEHQVLIGARYNTQALMLKCSWNERCIHSQKLQWDSSYSEQIIYVCLHFFTTACIVIRYL